MTFLDGCNIEDTSEPVTFDEPWQEMPNGVVFQAMADFRLQMLPLSQHG